MQREFPHVLLVEKLVPLLPRPSCHSRKTYTTEQVRKARMAVKAVELWLTSDKGESAQAFLIALLQEIQSLLVFTEKRINGRA